MDFLIPSSAGHDCYATPRTITLQDCKRLCLINPTCVGFSRRKNVDDGDVSGECWFKNNVMVDQLWNHTDWHTFIFNTNS